MKPKSKQHLAPTVARGITLELGVVAVIPALAGTSPERQWLRTEVPPERQEGRVYVPLRAAATALGKQVNWDPGVRQVTFPTQDGEVVLEIGSRQALVNGKQVQLATAPYIRSGRTLIPLRFAAEALDVPIHYEARTESVFLGPGSGGTVWVLPLESMKAGIVIRSPQRGETVTSPLRIQGQANVFEGTVVAELRSGGRVIAEGVGTGAMGQFGLFTIELTFDPPTAPRDAEIVAYSPSAKGDGARLSLVRLPIRLSP